MEVMHKSICAELKGNLECQDRNRLKFSVPLSRAMLLVIQLWRRRSIQQVDQEFIDYNHFLGQLGRYTGATFQN